MKPAPTASDETARLAALARYEILDTAPEREFDDLAKLAAQICDAPIARISFVDRDREWFKSHIGVPDTEGPRETSFCGHAILGRDVMVVPDARADDRFADSPLVLGDSGLRFYAGAPLVTSEGQALGTICVMDRVPRELDERRIEGLRALARQAVAQLELRRRMRLERQEAQEELRRKEANLALVAAQMPAVLWSTDTDLVITSSRGAGLREEWREPDRLVGVSLSEFFQTHDPEFPSLLAHRQALLGESVSFEVDWQGRSFAAHVEPLRKPDRTIGGVIGVALDVTARKRAERELSESISLLQATLDATADGILTVDEEGRIVSVNRRFRELFRVPEDLSVASDPNRLLAHVAEQLKEQTGFLKKVLGVTHTRDDEPPARIELADGRVFERTSRPQRSGERSLGRVWSFRDVTDEGHVEQELEHSLSLLRATLDATTDGVLVVDHTGRVASFNRRFLDMWKIPETLAISRDDSRLIAFVLDQLKDPERFLKKVRELYNQPDSQSYDWLEFKDGRVFERYSAPHRLGGKTIGRVWSFRDVSDRSRMEEILRRHTRTFEHLFDGVLAMDLTGKVLDCNPGAERIFGFKREEMLGRLAPIHDEREAGKQAARMLGEMRRQGRWAGEMRFRRKDGTEGVCDAVVVPLWDDYGRTVAALQICRDISELRRLQEAASPVPG
ncbi:MAG TPA: PAS domain S-box protein [Thermoanaerobaculia bacterium]|jgi:PAS domain S-box-containing protein